MSIIFANYQTNKKINSKNNWKPYQKKLQTLNNSINILVWKKKIKKKHYLYWSRQLKIQRGKNIMVKCKWCMNYLLLGNNWKKSYLKSPPTTLTSKLQDKQLDKDKIKATHSKLKSKKVHNKTGNKCVFRDGLG